MPPIEDPVSARRPSRFWTVGEGLRSAGNADQDQGPVPLEDLQVGVEVVGRGDRVEDKVEAAPNASIAAGSVETTTSSAPRARASASLSGEVVERHHLGPQRAGQLDADVPEPAEADDADPGAGPDAVVAQRRVGGDAGAQQRRRRRQVDLGTDLQREVLVDDDLVRVAAGGGPAGLILDAAIGVGEPAFAVLLKVLAAGLALAAGGDQAADPGVIADGEAVDLGADLADTANDLVAGDERVDGPAPLVARMCRSEWQTPQWRISIRTSCGPSSRRSK